MDIRRAYLACYNCMQLFLWTQVCTIALASAMRYDNVTLTPKPLFAAYIPYARAGQTLAWLEVAHAAIGLAGGGITSSFIQCLGRYVVLIHVIVPIQFMHSAWVTVIMILAWSIADMVRYTFYLRVLAGEGAFLQWLRYSAFIVLYPVGITSEWLVYFFTLSHIDKTEMFVINLPNAWNFAFNFGIWNRIVLVIYFYFGPFMFWHMLKQRRKKLRAS